MSEEATTTEFAAAITELGDKIAGLTLKEAVDLKNYLKEAYGLEPAAGGAVMMAGPADGAGEAAEEKTSFDVILEICSRLRIRPIVRCNQGFFRLPGVGLWEPRIELVGNSRIRLDLFPDG